MGRHLLGPALGVVFRPRNGETSAGAGGGRGAGAGGGGGGDGGADE